MYNLNTDLHVQGRHKARSPTLNYDKTKSAMTQTVSINLIQLLDVDFLQTDKNKKTTNRNRKILDY